MPRALRVLSAVWGIGGTLAVLLYAIVKLSRYSLEALAYGLGAVEWIVLIANVVFMAYAEGYRGFQLRFAPRVAARALHLFQNPTPLRALLAPLFCIGYFGATHKLMRLVWVGTALIVMLVFIVHQLGQPWRGILDAGVVVGLSWGSVSVLLFAVRAFQTRREAVSPEVPVAMSTW